MSETYLYIGPCADILARLEPCVIDSVVCDPPYGLKFMGAKWDYTIPTVEDWKAHFDVLKPGGYLLAFAGTRTQHRMACNIEDAGFEIRDSIAWMYGCLDQETLVATPEGAKPYHKTKIGDPVLCYNPETLEYGFEPILEIFEYEYEDTAFRLVGNSFEQVVTRRHRVITERDGRECLRFAETLELEENVPVLEDLQELLSAIHDVQYDASQQKHNMQQGLCECPSRCCEHWVDSIDGAEGFTHRVCCMQKDSVETCGMVKESEDSDVQQQVQWDFESGGIDQAFAQGRKGSDATGFGGFHCCDDRTTQPGLERGCDLQGPEGELRKVENKVRSMPTRNGGNDVAERVCCRTQAAGCNRIGSPTVENRSSAPQESQCDGQQAGELDVVCDTQRSSKVRAWSGHKTHMVRVVPFQLKEKVWCLRVPTGVFVAVRNGVAFPTGNSGFPKSGGLKPAHEPIIVARKPGKGAKLNIDECRVLRPQGDRTEYGVDGDEKPSAGVCYGTFNSTPYTPNEAGRYPANIIHDGSDVVTALFPSNNPGCKPHRVKASAETVERLQAKGWGFAGCDKVAGYDDGEDLSAARFFYCAKANKSDRNEGTENGNTHLTVKPTELMRYLVRLVTPEGGIVLDGFMGSGSTGKAAVLEGRDFVGIDLDPANVELAAQRIEFARSKCSE